MGEHEHEGSLLETNPTGAEVESGVPPALGEKESKESDRTEATEDVRSLKPLAVPVDPVMDETVKEIEREDEAAEIEKPSAEIGDVQEEPLVLPESGPMSSETNEGETQDSVPQIGDAQEEPVILLENSPMSPETNEGETPTSVPQIGAAQVVEKVKEAAPITEVEPMDLQSPTKDKGVSEGENESVAERINAATPDPIHGAIGSSPHPTTDPVPDDLPPLPESRPSSSQGPKVEDAAPSPQNIRRVSGPLEISKKIPGLPDILTGRPRMPSRWPSSDVNLPFTPSFDSDIGGVQIGPVPQTPSILAEVRNLRSFGSARTHEDSGEPGDEDIDDAAPPAHDAGELTRSQTWPAVDSNATSSAQANVDDSAKPASQQGPSQPSTAEPSSGQLGQGGTKGWASLFGIAPQFKR